VPSSRDTPSTSSLAPDMEIHLSEGNLNVLVLELFIDLRIDKILNVPGVVIVICPHDELSVKAGFPEFKKIY
jgi:hypothetical protein